MIDQVVTADSTLRITEIFYSIQGESNLVGLPTVFIRLTGCPLRCVYCDTSYAFHNGQKKTVTEILAEVQQHQAHYICVTGGEPLAQKTCLSLLKALCDQSYVVSLETSGAVSVAEVDPRVIKILDIKTPGSKEESKNLWDNLQYLQKHDQIKFVITDRNDYDYVVKIISQYQLTQKCEVLFSPSYGQLAAETLAAWILTDRLAVRLQVQLHKILWGEVQGK